VSGPFGRDALDGIPDCSRAQYVKAIAVIKQQWDDDELLAMVIGTSARDLPARIVNGEAS
jgi:hypothetical protein